MYRVSKKIGILTISHIGCHFQGVYWAFFNQNSNSMTYTFLLFWLHSILGNSVIGGGGGGSTWNQLLIKINYEIFRSISVWINLFSIIFILHFLFLPFFVKFVGTVFSDSYFSKCYFSDSYFSESFSPFFRIR